MGNNYVYMFQDYKGSSLYVGLTQSLDKRIKLQHFASSSHLNEECLKATTKIVYHVCSCKDDMKIRERYLINRLNPKYNDKMKNDGQFSYQINFQWNNFDFNSIDLLHRREINIYKKEIRKLKNHSCEVQKEKCGNSEINFCEIEDITFFRTVIKYEGKFELIKMNCLAIMVNNEIYVIGDSHHYFFCLMALLQPITKKSINRIKKEFRIHDLEMSNILRVKSKKLETIKWINNPPNNNDFTEFISFDIALRFLDPESIEKIAVTFSELDKV